jgi:hypothetical protein
MKRYCLLWMLVLTTLLSACNFPTVTNTAPPQVVPTSTPTLEQLVATSLPTQDPTRYYNTEGGFSLKLPEGWQVSGPFEVTNDPARPYIAYLLSPSTDQSLRGGPGISRIVLADPAQWNVEKLVLDQCSTCPVNPPEEITLDGISALRTQVGGGDVPFLNTWVFVEHRGKWLGFAIHDPETLAPLEEVIQSIQFD